MRYDIQGGILPVVICNLEAGESIITEGGAMSWMSPNMQMETKGGGFAKAIGRSFTGEKMFQNIYTAQGGPGMIAMASSFPGSIKAFQITPGNDIILQKRSFLASDAGVSSEVHFNGKVGAGFFGGEGFIMQRFTGNGIAFAEFDGYIVEYNLQAGQSIVLDTGHLAAMTASCSMDVQSVPGLKNKLLGGEGFFNTRVTGPGHVWIQTMPASKLAGAIAPYVATGSH